MRRLALVALVALVLLPTAEASSRCSSETTILPDGRIVTCYVCRYGDIVIASPCQVVG